MTAHTIPEMDSYYDQDEEHGFTDDRVEEIAAACLRKGAQVCREMMARFVEQGGDKTTAASVRANWNPAWGEDPGKIDNAEYEQLQTTFDPMSVDA
jgi:hypothetical protein